MDEVKGEDLKAINKFKSFSRLGFYGNLKIINEPIQGACVIATKQIQKRTILCEYVGNVCIQRNILRSSNDSIMDLLITGSADTSLSIVPLDHANISRFINGINNTKAHSNML